MREQIFVSTLGLAGNRLQSLASMLSFAKELKDNYRLIDPADASADLMFVNADNPGAVAKLSSILNSNRLLVPIMVTGRTSTVSDQIVLVRPMVLSRVIQALEEATALHQSLEKEPMSLAAATQRILVVDDSLSVRTYMEQKVPLLSQTPVSMSFAASGEEAMEKVMNGSHDLIFLDVVMPGVDGYKVCKWIKWVRPDTRVAMLTSKTSPFDKLRGAMSGCNDYLVKPPEDEELAKILHAL